MKNRRTASEATRPAFADIPQQQPEEQPDPGYPEDRVDEERRQLPGADLRAFWANRARIG